MYIKDLSIKNYRNYSDYSIGLTEGINLIIGRNAVGKTNLLEAIYFLDNGKSHRTNSHKELVKWDSDFSIIKASLQRLDRSDIIIEATVLNTGVKQLKVNGVVQKRGYEKNRPINTVIFTPDHLKIVKEMPEHRRYYIDEILEKVKVDYRYWRQQYSKVLRQRNMLLKRVFIGRMKKDVIDYWDEQLIEAGIKVITARKIIIEKLGLYADILHKKISGEETDLSLRYENQLLSGDESQDLLKKTYIDQLRQKRRAEIERGQTLVGPHRDDMGIYVNDVDIRKFGSQGEQRSASLALKIAEFSIIKDIIKESPILLLDDVMSELDEAKRRALMESIKNGSQTIITSTNMEYFKDNDISAANIVEVN